jgi:PAS domain S-box-containing protein
MALEMRINATQLYSTLVHSMSEAIIYADAGGLIQFWNASAERMFGFREAEAIGQSLEIIIPENLRVRHWSGFDSAMKTGRFHYTADAVLAVPAIRKDGKRISVEFTVVPFRDEAGGMVGIAAVLRDVTARFEETKALRKQLAEAQERLKHSIESDAHLPSGGADLKS